eukprot:UN10939
MAWLFLTQSTWRVFLLIATLPLWFSIVASFYFHRSTHWLMGQNKLDETPGTTARNSKNQ